MHGQNSKVREVRWVMESTVGRIRRTSKLLALNETLKKYI